MSDSAGVPALETPDPRVVHSHFDLDAYAPGRKLMAWRERVGHVIDVLHSRADLERPFDATIARYEAGDLSLTRCRSDAIELERTLARISTDKVRDYAFHVFVEGGMDEVKVHSASHDGGGLGADGGSILALDMNEPVHMRRGRCHVITLFAPASLVQQEFAWPEALHGRTAQPTTPLLRLAVDHVVALDREIACMSLATAEAAMRESTRLLVAAFARQTRMSGDARAAVRAAMFGQVRRYVQANLHHEGLSPERVLGALELPRPTLYRMFQHEGGLGSYIRHLRLRQAADDLRLRPDLMVTDIAYGLGFRSASDFTRAFRRAYGMTPQDFRVMCAEATAKANGRI